MCAVVLIDTDSLLGLVYSSVGQTYLEQSKNLRITEGVKEEICGLQSNRHTQSAAHEVQDCIEANPNVDFYNPLTQSSVDHASGDDTKGEQSIHDYIVYGDEEVEVVLFFDSDMKDIMGRLNYPPPRFDVVSSLFTYFESQLGRKQIRKETGKIAYGRGWLSRRNLEDLFVESDIMSRQEFDYYDVRQFCVDQTHDL